jgi:hypothetical protein
MVETLIYLLVEECPKQINKVVMKVLRECAPVAAALAICSTAAIMARYQLGSAAHEIVRASACSHELHARSAFALQMPRTSMLPESWQRVGAQLPSDWATGCYLQRFTQEIQDKDL